MRRLVLLLLLLPLSACRGARSDVDAAPRPALSELQAGQAELNIAARLTVVALQFNQGASLAGWWSSGQPAAEAEALARWQVNGLDAIVLGGPPKASELPVALGRRRWAIAAGPQWSSIDVAPPYRAAVNMVYHPPFGGAQTLKLKPGRPQLLVQARREADRFIITLLPHHYQPLATVRVRSAQEQMLDGVSFEPLALEVAMQGGQVLAVGLRESTQPAVEPAAAAPAAAEADQVSVEQAPAPPLNLGALLLQARHMNQPSQALVLLLVSESPSPPAK